MGKWSGPQSPSYVRRPRASLLDTAGSTDSVRRRAVIAQVFEKTGIGPCSAASPTGRLVVRAFLLRPGFRRADATARGVIHEFPQHYDGGVVRPRPTAHPKFARRCR